MSCLAASSAGCGEASLLVVPNGILKIRSALTGAQTQPSRYQGGVGTQVHSLSSRLLHIS